MQLCPVAMSMVSSDKLGCEPSEIQTTEFVEETKPGNNDEDPGRISAIEDESFEEVDDSCFAEPRSRPPMERNLLQFNPFAGTEEPILPPKGRFKRCQSIPPPMGTGIQSFHLQSFASGSSFATQSSEIGVGLQLPAQGQPQESVELKELQNNGQGSTQKSTILGDAAPGKENEVTSKAAVEEERQNISMSLIKNKMRRKPGMRLTPPSARSTPSSIDDMDKKNSTGSDSSGSSAAASSVIRSRSWTIRASEASQASHASTDPGAETGRDGPPSGQKSHRIHVPHPHIPHPHIPHPHLPHPHLSLPQFQHGQHGKRSQLEDAGNISPTVAGRKESGSLLPPAKGSFKDVFKSLLSGGEAATPPSQSSKLPLPGRSSSFYSGDGNGAGLPKMFGKGKGSFYRLSNQRSRTSEEAILSSPKQSPSRKASSNMPFSSKKSHGGSGSQVSSSSPLAQRAMSSYSAPNSPRGERSSPKADTSGKQGQTVQVETLRLASGSPGTHRDDQKDGNEDLARRLIEMQKHLDNLF